MARRKNASTAATSTARPRSTRVALGLDFGTESVRALLVDLNGRELAASVSKYRHGQVTRTLPDSSKRLPPLFALQHPDDWLNSAGRAIRGALRNAHVSASSVIGIGVDFTSCTMLPCKVDGTPLCLVNRTFAKNPYAWPKLWKHHGAQPQTDRINEIARRRNEPWLDRYGGVIGLEWFFPKILETLDHAPDVCEATDVWIEGGDWLVWQLVGGDANWIPRSTCQAGYKAMWSRRDGYPSGSFFKAVHPEMANVVREKMPGHMLAPGECAGMLTKSMARKIGLREGVPVSAAIIDAHAGVPGAGVASPDTLVMVMGTSSCHMLMSREEKHIPGIAGIVEDGILPGYVGYETGQAAVGDAFDWFRQLVGEKHFDALTNRAAAIDPDPHGVLCLDWMNGCRTPLMDGDLRGAFTGLSLAHGAEHLYRALLEASAFGVRWIIDVLEDGGVPVRKLVATGGLPHHNELLVQIYADVLGRSITIHPSSQGPALGAAILGAVAAGPEVTGFRSIRAATRALASASSTQHSHDVKSNRSRRKTYNALYRRYRDLATSQSRG